MNATIDPATIKYSSDSQAPLETLDGWKLRNSPKAAAVIVSSTPPTSICAPELIIFEAGRGSLRVSADEIDKLTEATTSAIAPRPSIGAPPRLSDRLTSAPTPAIPISSAIASRAVSLCVRSSTISLSAMNAGMVAIITAVSPEGTRCSAQNTIP